MQIGNLPVCSIDVFGDDVKDFWIGALETCSKIPVFQCFHQNSFYMILIIEQAMGAITIENESISIQNVQLIIIKPNIINKLLLDSVISGKIICFTEDFFSIRYNDNMLHQFSFFEKERKEPLFVTEKNLCFIKKILSFTEGEFHSNEKDSQKALRSYLNIFLIEIERMYTPSKGLKIKGFSKEMAFRFQKMVRQDYIQLKLPSDYANKLNISTNYLNKISKRYFGISSGELIRSHLILESKRILYHTNLSVGEVASKLGFEYASYFISFFKKQTGETPEHFRKSSDV